MSDSYNPSGVGPHPTMAGNLLDPKVQADGQKGGLGVGGTSEANVRREGAEHIAKHGDQSQGGYDSAAARDETGRPYGSRSDNNTSTGGIRSELEGATGRGQSDYDNSTTGGLSSHNTSTGGLRSELESGSGRGQSGYDNSTTSGGSSGIDNSFSTGHGGPITSHTHDNVPSGLTGNGSDYLREQGGVAETTGGHHHGNHHSSNTGDDLPSNYKSSGIASEARTGGQDFTGTGGRDENTLSSTRDPLSNSSRNARDPVDSNVRTDNTTSSSGRTGLDDTTSSSTHGTSSQSRDTADDSYTKGGPPPSIPTAGGERIGTKHWGESKIVPDNPPRRESEATKGVSSAAGHSDDLTARNTASNTTGSSTTEGKESMVDKIKDKLHMGHK